MQEVEKIIGVTGAVDRHREGVLSRLAGWRIANKKAEIDVAGLFHDILSKIQEHYHGQHQGVVQEIYQAMLTLGTDQEESLSEKNKAQAKETYRELQRRFGYDEGSARESLKFMLKYQTKRKRS